MDGYHPQAAVPAAASPARWAWLRIAGAGVILGVLVWRLGTGPFLAGLARVDAASLVTAGAVAVVTTLCCAWRWSLVAARLGVEVPVRSAVVAYYRSQFLNVATPGGVLGDVDRGLRHGRQVRDRSGSLRSVVWDRFAGQMVLVVVAGVGLVLLPSPVQHLARVVATGLAIVALVLGAVVIALRALPWRGSVALPPRGASVVRRVRADLSAVLLDAPTRSWVLLASLVALVGHVVTFLVAARTAGAGGRTLDLVPLSLVVILAMGLPNLAGWGPREGVAAWVFGLGGLGAEQGVATAVVYGVMAFVGALPGAVVLLLARPRRPEGARRG